MDNSGNIRLLPIEDEDISTCFEVVSSSFGHDAPFVDNYFPNHDTPFGRMQGSNRLLAWKQNSRDSVFLKAVVVSSNSDATQNGVGSVEEHIAGMAVWTHMKDVPPQKLEDVENVEEVWPDMADRRFMASLWEEYVKPRSQAVRDSHGRGVFVLELLAVHPTYQRMGAGTALVSWGIKAADKEQVKAVVEGTPAGRRLYENCGFSAEIEEMSFDTGDEFTDRTKPKLIFLTRDPVV
ncbi:hypothetical protein F5Y08DRAFT_309704 [Xylaria arbuscula]|uniref:N-acetyltransferase domain-containing protein n=1 Tax=Xylaria arbuscula TaxID=114810 RepID=A0A9W8NLV8_9PEZI|nr:hypothetical protein F5Y08DRAFT_309704 [Xylaria arbuscula]KAJ3579081.1 hypothetical protein NPX13_g1481 [Xylaria arbuscula]